MKLIKKLLINIVGPFFLIIGVLAFIDSSKYREELSPEEKKQIQAFFTDKVNSK